MQRKLQIAALLIFVLLLSLPGIYQAVREKRDQKSIEFSHLPLDMFLTPLRRQDELAHGLDSLLVQLDSAYVALRTGAVEGPVDTDFTLPSLDDSAAVWPEAPEAPASDPAGYEDFWQQAQNLVQRAGQINHYRSVDSSHARVLPFARLSARFGEVAGNAQAGEMPSADQLIQLRQATEALHDSLRAQNPLLLIGDAILRWTLFDATYLRAWEKGLESNSVSSTKARERVQIALYQLFGDLGEKGVAGKDHWAFYKPGLHYATRPFGSETGESPLAAIQDMAAQLRKRHIGLLVVVVPDKESIYPEMASSAFTPSQSGRVSHGPAFVDTLRAHGIATVDLFSALSDERRHGANPLYLRTDTHWSPQGMKRAASEIASALRPMLENASPASVEYAFKDTLVERQGDILDMSGLKRLGIPFAPESVKARQVYAISRDSTGQEVDRSPYRDNMRESPVLLLGDSFSRIYQTDAPHAAGLVAHLALELGHPLASLVSDGGASTLVRERLARKSGVLRGKKVVVWEFVERDLRYGAEGWKQVALF